MKRVLFAVLLGLGISTANSQTLFDLTFDAPTHSVGQVVSTGSGPNVVSQIVFGTPTIVPSIGSVNSAALQFNMAGNAPLFYYDQIQLTLPSNTPTALQIDFDFFSSGLIGSSARFVMLCDTPSGVRNFEFTSSGTVSMLGAAPLAYVAVPVLSFSNLELLHFSVIIERSFDRWTAYENGRPVSSGNFGGGASISSIRFSYGLVSSDLTPDSLSYVTVDNLRIAAAAVPEPSTLGLMAFAGLILLGAKWRQTRRRACQRQVGRTQP